MAKKRSDNGLNRRQFITGAGSAFVTGAVAAFATLNPSYHEAGAAQALKPSSLPVSGLIVHNPKVCAGCGVCNMMCSLQHYGESGLSLSNAELVRDPFNAEFAFHVCQQCKSPECYFACPNMDAALCIDRETGVTYVNQEECVGCGECVKACPFEPKRIKLHPKTELSMVCDLCRNRKEGPICVEYCPMKALTYVPAGKRSG